MKLSHPISYIALVISVLFLSCCTPDHAVEISCDEFYETPLRNVSIDVAEGDVFSISLCSNPTTGFMWSEQPIISDQAIIKQVEHSFTGPGDATKPPAPGTPGVEEWEFKALKPGAGTIIFEYSQPWDGGEKGAWGLTINVEVR